MAGKKSSSFGKTKGKNKSGKNIKKPQTPKSPKRKPLPGPKPRATKPRATKTKKIPEVHPNKDHEPSDLRRLITPTHTTHSVQSQSDFKLLKEFAQVQNGDINVNELEKNDLRRNIKRSIRKKSVDNQKQIDRRLAKEDECANLNNNKDMDLLKAVNVKHKKNLGITIPRSRLGFSGNNACQIERSKTPELDVSKIPTKLIVLDSDSDDESENRRNLGSETVFKRKQPPSFGDIQPKYFQSKSSNPLTSKSTSKLTSELTSKTAQNSSSKTTSKSTSKSQKVQPPEVKTPDTLSDADYETLAETDKLSKDTYTGTLNDLKTDTNLTRTSTLESGEVLTRSATPMNDESKNMFQILQNGINLEKTDEKTGEKTYKNYDSSDPNTVEHVNPTRNIDDSFINPTSENFRLKIVNQKFVQNSKTQTPGDKTPNSEQGFEQGSDDENTIDLISDSDCPESEAEKDKFFENQEIQSRDSMPPTPPSGPKTDSESDNVLENLEILEVDDSILDNSIAGAKELEMDQPYFGEPCMDTRPDITNSNEWESYQETVKSTPFFEAYPSGSYSNPFLSKSSSIPRSTAPSKVKTPRPTTHVDPFYEKLKAKNVTSPELEITDVTEPDIIGMASWNEKQKESKKLWETVDNKHKNAEKALKDAFSMANYEIVTKPSETTETLPENNYIALPTELGGGNNKRKWREREAGNPTKRGKKLSKAQKNKLKSLKNAQNPNIYQNFAQNKNKQIKHDRNQQKSQYQKDSEKHQKNLKFNKFKNFKSGDQQNANQGELGIADFETLATEDDPGASSNWQALVGENSVPNQSKNTFIINTSQKPAQPHAQTTQTPKKQYKLGERRLVIIDGANVGTEYGEVLDSRNIKFHAKALRIVSEYFEKLGNDVTIFLPPVRRYPDARHKYKTADFAELKKLENEGKINYTPANRRPNAVGTETGNENRNFDITYYDDEFMIDLAKDSNGVILSLDHFRDIKKAADKETLRVINTAVLSYMWVKVGMNKLKFLPAGKPWGSKGDNTVTLDQFLRLEKLEDEDS